jgi:4-amino-4-deoxy-L-arabinose transferase-like glycosyltransferase
LVAAGRAIWNPAAALWAGALAAVAPLHIYYSQEARPYASVTLFLVLFLHALWRAVQKGGVARWALYAAWTALALFTHYFAILVVAPAAVLVALWPDAEQRTRAFRGYACATALVLGPWLVWLVWSLLVTPHPHGAHQWIARIWENIPPAWAIPKSMELLVFGSHAGLVPGFFKQFTALEFSPAGRGVGLLALVLLWAAALVPWGEARMGIDGCARRKLWLCAVAFTPLLALWLVSWVRPYYVVGRYDLVALPAHLLLLGFALAKLQAVPRFGRALATGVAVVVFATLGAKLSLYHRAPTLPGGPSARSTALAIDTTVGNGDLVVLSAWRGIPAHYYLRRLGYRRSGENCEKRDSDRAFLCPRVSANDESIVLDFDHLDRIAFSPEKARADLREMIARVGSGPHAVWAEQRRGPAGWLVWTQMASEELARAGFGPRVSGTPLERLRFQRYASER